MTNDEKIAIALKSDYLSELSVFEMLPNSRMRSGFDRRMKKMISESYTDTAKTVRRRRVKLRLAIAVIIAATAALATGGTILLKHWDTFAVKENDKYSVILISDAEDSPQCITRYYEPDLDKTAYATRLIEKTEYAYIVEYINKHGKQLIFTQCTRSQMENAQIGTEDAQIPPEKVELGDTSAMYCVSKKGMAFLMWDNGEYMFHITATGFGRDELFRIAMSIKELSAD